jgi:outer membrane protein OmpA-like peptidoglycan-associated protein
MRAGNGLLLRARSGLVGLALVSAIVALASETRAGEPVVGLDLGAALPISTFKQTADPGGSIAPFLGYQFGNRGFAFTPLVQPMYVIFGTNSDVTNQQNRYTTIFAITAGARASLFDEKKEIFLSAQGGYYDDIYGPIDDKSGGFNIAAGFNYEIWRGTALGAFFRYDQTNMRAARGEDADLKFVSPGLSLRHRFLPPVAPPVAAAPPPAPAPPPPPVKKRIVLRGVQFDFDKAAIRPDAAPILDEAARTLAEEGEIAISVDGHTDSVGSEEYNERLSMRRAMAVRDYLAAKGIDASRMTVQGFGESRPVATNDTAEGRAQNRRVELNVKP